MTSDPPIAGADDTLGVILAGGLARRMGGGDKPLLRVGGRPMVAWLIDRLAAELPGGRAAIRLNANGAPERLAALGLPVIADPVGGFAGPLAGVLAGLEAAAGVGAPWVLTVAGDTPFPPDGLLRRLRDRRDAEAAEIVLAATRDADGETRAHPTFGLWAAALAPALRRALVEEGARKVVDFVHRRAWALEPFEGRDPATGLDAFFNVNTPEDLARADAAARGRAAPAQERSW